MVYVLGIALGTSSLKGILADNDGKVKAVASSEYSLSIQRLDIRNKIPKLG